ncbi:MAG: LicD family protein [Synergistaceae bacterium]|nr:LicD family protein [Synergistaceae bacterium]
MHQLTLEELRKNQLEILDVVSSFCEERGINYWLDFGTLIGAIRHKGYIPWDDDIDISMLRPDYDKFMREFNGHNPRYDFHSIENDPDFPYAFGKVMDKKTTLYNSGIKWHVNIDIFVMDNAPDDDREARKMFFTRRWLNRSNARRVVSVLNLPPAIRRKNILRRLCEYITRGILRVFPRNYFTRKIIEVSKRYSNQATRRVGNFTGAQDAMIDREALSSVIDVEFEGRTYKAPSGYDEWLRLIYGDYMELPPVEERVTNHELKAYRED